VDAMAVDYILEYKQKNMGRQEFDAFVSGVLTFLGLVDMDVTADQVKDAIRQNPRLEGIRVHYISPLTAPRAEPAEPEPPAEAATVKEPGKPVGKTVSRARRQGKSDAGPGLETLPQTVAQTYVRAVPLHPPYCRDNCVLQKQLLLVQLGILNQLRDDERSRAVDIAVRADSVPMALWDHIQAIFNGHKTSYSATVSGFSMSGGRANVLNITWGPWRDQPAGDETSGLTMPLDVNVCRREPAFVRLLVLMQMKIADRIITNREAHGTQVTVLADIAEFSVWQRVRDIFAHAPGYTATFQTVEGDGGQDEIELAISWN
jgi:hypothetical protein